MPVVAADVANAQLFSCLDPAADMLLGLFQTAINAELQAVWNVARAGTSLAAANPVQDTAYQLPDKALLREAKFGFPLLAITREEGEFSEHTLDQEEVKTKWSIDYILGPLTPEDFRKLAAVMNAVRSVILLTIRQRGHPTYRGGELQFFPGRGHFASVRLVSYKQGSAQWGPEGEGQVIYALQMVMETTEHEYGPEGFVGEPDPHYGPETMDPPFVGTSLSLGLGGDGGVIPDETAVRTEFPPGFG